jgi:hypothetical protein
MRPQARWLFPLYLVAINLFVIPIALAGLAIHRDHAIKTGAHAAPKPALRSLGRFAQRQNAGSRKRCGNALARQGFHRSAIEAYPDRRRRRGDMGVM